MLKPSRFSTVTPEGLLHAVKTIAGCLDFAPLETLEKAHKLVYDHYMTVLDSSRGSLDNAAEQRVLGMLWAEIEVAIDERR